MNSALKMLADWPLGTLFAIVLVLASVLIGVMILRGVYIVGDSWWLPARSAQARVVSKRYTPPELKTLLIYNASLKASLPQPYVESAAWSLTLEVDKEQAIARVDESVFNASPVGSIKQVSYVRGRFSRRVYIQSVV